MKKVLLLFISFVIVSSSLVFSQPIIYDFESGTAAPSQQPSSVPANDAIFGSGLGVPGTGGSFPQGFPSNGFSFSADDWSTGALDLDDYLEVGFTNEFGATIQVTGFGFNERRSGTGIRDIEVRYSTDIF
ncbi:MAG: hypothetical protein R2879_20690 [Saprospiraceae bacterium]